MKSVTAGAGMPMRHDAAMASRLIANAMREPDVVSLLTIAIFGDCCWYHVQEEDRRPDNSTPFWKGTAAVMSLLATESPSRLLFNY